MKKLTTAQRSAVREAIRLRRTLTYKALAARFGVSMITIQRAANGRSRRG